jgi:hypothetical protein
MLEIDVTAENLLIEKFLKGDTSSFEELITHYENKVYLLALELSNSVGIAEYLLQQVFAEVYTQLVNKGFRAHGLLETENGFEKWILLTTYQFSKSGFLFDLEKEKLRPIKKLEETKEPEFVSFDRETIGNKLVQ